MNRKDFHVVGRRAFFASGLFYLAAASLDGFAPNHLFARGGLGPGGLQIGLLTDLHYADKPPVGCTLHRATPEKLAEAAELIPAGKSFEFRGVELGRPLSTPADSVAAELGLSQADRSGTSQRHLSRTGIAVLESNHACVHTDDRGVPRRRGTKCWCGATIPSTMAALFRRAGRLLSE